MDQKPSSDFNREQHLTDVAKREAALIAEVEKRLPEFSASCHQEAKIILLHQDAFAAAYQDDEFRLLGMVIKYAGINGKEVHITGRNRETV